MIVEQCEQEILQVCKELVEESKIIGNLERVSHLSSSFIQFHGGILGTVREYRERKRLEELINTPICGEWTFYTYAFHLYRTAKFLVEKQIEIQKILTKEDERYYANIELIMTSVNQAHAAWYEYSPDMAMEGIRIGDEDNISLELTIDSLIVDEFKKMDLPDTIHFEEHPPKKGCLGVLLILLLPMAIPLFL